MYIYLIIVAFTFAYLYSKKCLNYWKDRGVKYEEPIIFIGGSFKQFTDNVSLAGRFTKLYKAYPNEKFVGYFKGHKPGLLIRDPELIKHILQTDFRSFHHRGANFGRDKEILMKNLFNVDGDIWKLMRQKLTPTFSSGKLKAMFPLIVECAEKLLVIADELAERGDEVDIRDLMARYTTDFIGACGFGIEADALNDEESDFRKLGKRIFASTFRDYAAVALKSLAPSLFRSMTFFPPEVNHKTVMLVKQIMTQRNYKPSGRNDFIDMMLELKQKEKIVGESVDKRNPDGSFATVELDLDELLLAAQVFVFFAAGFETSSSASSFLLHMLAYYPEEQARCQQNIDEVLARHGGKLSFDAVKEMKYLEMAFKESLRVFPSPGIIIRRSVAKYTFPGTNLTVDPQTTIMISLEALHNDEKYFDEPSEFRPARFHPDNQEVKKYVYMPFGEGPRACIGERLGIMQSMAGVAAILSKFSVAPSKNTVREPRVDYKSNIIQVIVGGLPLSLKRRK